MFFFINASHLREAFFLIMVLFFSSMPFFSSDALEFCVYYTGNVPPKISFQKVIPFIHYAPQISMSFFYREKMPCFYYSGKISVRVGELKTFPAAEDRVYIFIVPEQIRGKGGWMTTSDTKKRRYVFVRENFSEEELCHELCHAIAGLGDEYGGKLSSYPKELSSLDGTLAYPNLTWLPSGFAAWKNLEKELNYFPGGLGYDVGIYHAYEECLMNDLSQPLCPVCRFYLEQALEILCNYAKYGSD